MCDGAGLPIDGAGLPRAIHVRTAVAHGAPGQARCDRKLVAMFFIFTWELPNLAKDSDVDFFLWPTATAGNAKPSETPSVGLPDLETLKVCLAMG